ncbi:phage virion morphogenesis protein [Citrobacter portucalensis]|uniref:phage virion morphogenesis protein n=1 Tax=Citrobacter portucalensis TaxID=1639133 RepID=UPI00226B5A77|nr:phage virion morphogenesis protein [Citrobacter portucalensis]MCX9038490.1 phage virion morphogenesis protein [Citrobacter portucalensis]
MMKVTVDSRALSQALKQLERAGTDMRPLMRNIAGTLATETALNFEEEGRPAWVPSLAAEERNGMTLSDTGHLRRSITTQYDHHSAQIGTNVEYARIHQLGGTIKRKERSVYKKVAERDSRGRFLRWGNSEVTGHVREHSATYPARPFLPVTSTGQLQSGVEQKLLRNALTYLENAAKS